MSAIFSDDGIYRYTLTRYLDAIEGNCVFVGLNPSTADATTDDATVRRCIRFARDWGYGRLTMVNLYAFRATNPRKLRAVDDPVGPDNDHHVSIAFGEADLIVAAWGAGAQRARLADFTRLFGTWPFYALGRTKSAAPRHPLYMPADSEPIPYRLRRS